MVHKKQTLRVILLFHCQQLRIIGPPERRLPRALEEIAFRDVGPRTWGDLQQFVHGSAYLAGMPPSGLHIRLMSCNARKRRWSLAGDYGQSKRVQHGRIRSRVIRSTDLFGWGTSETLVEMQTGTPVTAARKQRFNETKLLLLLQE